MKYLVGQRFKTNVNQQLKLNHTNGVPVPFAQVTKERIDIPAGSIVHLVADYQVHAENVKKRAYVLKVDSKPIYFIDYVMSRKYELSIEDDVTHDDWITEQKL